MGEILYGTSSWSESSWSGVFYPRGMPPGEYLFHYATRYRTVEADVTYYRIPSTRMVSGWERKTPEGFLLSAKFPRSIVHAGESKLPDAGKLLKPSTVGEEVERFLETMAILGAKCGPLVLQFPYFNKRVFSGPEPFLERLDAFLDRLPGEFRFAVEVRNRAWIAAPLLSLLRRHGVALVLVDLSYMPHPADLAADFDLATADFAYARLIGDRKAVEEKTDTFDRIVIDRGPRLERWADLLRGLVERTAITLVYANNHYAGHAPATVDELAGLVGGEGAA
jgi:uncharacterized protein YecE (DUF72 family)